MKEELIKFETAVLAKEKGFDEKCNYYFHNQPEFGSKDLLKYPKVKSFGSGAIYNSSYGFSSYEIFYYNNTDIENRKAKKQTNKDKRFYELCTAPTQSLLQRWLREVYKIHVSLDNVNVPEKEKWIYEINKLPCGVLVLWNKETSPTFDSYEEALESGLYEALKLVKNES